MAFTEIPTQDEFKKACGRTLWGSPFKKYKDLDPIFSALGQAEPYRKSVLPAAIPYLRKVRKACCDWIHKNKSITRVSAPKVKALFTIVHSTINEIVEKQYGGRRLGLPQKPTFKDVVNRVMEVRGTVAGPVGRALDENYWIEKILPKHLGKGKVGSPFNEWKTAQTRLNFADWLEHVYVPECEDDLQGACNSIRNWQRLQSMKHKGVRYCDAEERKSYVITINGGKVSDAAGDVYDTADTKTEFSGKGWAIFVMAPDDTLYAHSHLVDEFHHSSFLAGGPVKCAGEIKVHAGVIEKVTPKTGHYKAGAPELNYFLKFCQDNGVPLKNVQVCPNPFAEPKKWFAGDLVLLAEGKEPTPEIIAAVEKKPAQPVTKLAQPPAKGTQQVSKPTLPAFKVAQPVSRHVGVQDRIKLWENMWKQHK